ncbi:MAG: DUF2817 domain-containing protein [Phycisphaerales bacterium]|nr:DUF2817 domain-containing protein [Phycisphaerales bacterium]
MIAYIRPGRSRRTVMVFGGFHGDEPKSVFVANCLIELLSTSRTRGDATPFPSPTKGDATFFPSPKRGDATLDKGRRYTLSPAPAGKATWIIVPLVNPDGFALRKRRNARGVDLNRNFPTRNRQPGAPRSRMYGGPSPASEPETRAVMRIIERYQPDRMVTIHSIGCGRYCNNYDGPARTIAMAMSRRNGYPVTANIGYPTPGSFGTWAGIERGISVVTLELPSAASPQRCWLDNRDALLCLA